MINQLKTPNRVLQGLWYDFKFASSLIEKTKKAALRGLVNAVLRVFISE